MIWTSVDENDGWDNNGVKCDDPMPCTARRECPENVCQGTGSSHGVKIGQATFMRLNDGIQL